MKAITLRKISAGVQRIIGAILRDRKDMHRDLDSLAGSWSASEGQTFQGTIDAVRQIDAKLWR